MEKEIIIPIDTVILTGMKHVSIYMENQQTAAWQVEVCAQQRYLKNQIGLNKKKRKKAYSGEK